MGATKANLRFIVQSTNHESSTIIISNSPGVIENIKFNIDDFARKNSKGINISKDSSGYTMNSKSYRAIQDIIYHEIQ